MKLKILKKRTVLVTYSLITVILFIPSAVSSADQPVLRKVTPVQFNKEVIKKLPKKTPTVQKKLPVKIAPIEIEPLKTVPQTRDLQTRPPEPVPRVIQEFPPLQDPDEGLGERVPIQGTASFPTEQDPEGRLNPDGTSRQRPPCFIATAAYGNPMAEKIVVLGNFRDEYLLKHPLGRWFVGVYYKNSSPVAAVIARHESLRFITRAMLWPIVYAIMYPYYVVVFLVLSGIALVSLAILRRQFGKAHQPTSEGLKGM